MWTRTKNQVYVSLDLGHNSELVTNLGGVTDQIWPKLPETHASAEQGEKKSNSNPELIKMPKGGRELYNLAEKLQSCEKEGTGELFY